MAIPARRRIISFRPSIFCTLVIGKIPNVWLRDDIASTAFRAHQRFQIRRINFSGCALCLHVYSAISAVCTITSSICLTPSSPRKLWMAAFVRLFAQKVTTKICPVELLVKFFTLHCMSHSFYSELLCFVYFPSVFPQPNATYNYHILMPIPLDNP